MPKSISIVFPMYNEEESILPLLNATLPVVSKITKDYEIIFVDDGSKDKTPKILEQLKKIGEVKSFNENSNDETQQHQDLTALIETEKSRLARYQQMYKEASLVSDKIQLSDKIFDEERLIKSYEDSLNGLNNRVSYSSIYLSINEKQSDYSNIVWAKFSQLIQSLVESINSLFKLIFIILPWAFAIFIIWIIIRLIKNH